MPRKSSNRHSAAWAKRAAAGRILAADAPGKLVRRAPEGVALKLRGRNKFGNERTNGYASKREAIRAGELQLLARIGEISGLREQVAYELVPAQDGERAVNYIADFVYTEKSGALIVEDAKGVRTKEYRIKRKLMLWRHGIRIQEV